MVRGGRKKVSLNNLGGSFSKIKKRGDLGMGNVECGIKRGRKKG